ncbi:MAG: hypothetical protein ACLRFP_01690 [Alphaproteobacteria bacterium]
MDKNDLRLRPTDVSQIGAIYDTKGRITGWTLTVTFDSKNIVPPHARGARFSVKPMENSTQVEYKFPESVMREGIQRAWLFKEAIEKQIARLNNENIK